MKTVAQANKGRRLNKRKPKEQINVIVHRSIRERATWQITIVHHDGSLWDLKAMLPGEFRTMHIANRAANALAASYRDSGYNVALKTAKRQSQQQTRR